MYKRIDRKTSVPSKRKQMAEHYHTGENDTAIGGFWGGVHINVQHHVSPPNRARNAPAKKKQEMAAHMLTLETIYKEI